MRSVVPPRHALAGVTLAVTATALVGAAPAATASSLQGPDLPRGVVKLHDGQACPDRLLCVYRDNRRRGTAYGIRSGNAVNLSSLPITGGEDGHHDMGNNASSWVNNTNDRAALTDRAYKGGFVRYLDAGKALEESRYNDSVDNVTWGSG